MRLELPEKLNELAFALPCPLYVVGGFVRNALLGISNERQDIDISAPISLEEFVECAQKVGFLVKSVYKNTGTAKIASLGAEAEFSSFRHDSYIRGHRPEKVTFTTDISLDAKRRDFCCNAVYYDIKRGEIVDPLGGVLDIEKRLLRCVREADRVFSEDGLRLMRLVRFSAQLNFEIDDEALRAAKKNVDLLYDISVERTFEELKKILLADTAYGEKGGAYRGVELLREIGALKVILPELALGEGIMQNPAFHDHDVLEHSLRTVKYADKSIRLAALLHDVGKPYCYKTSGNFFDHEDVGAEIAVKILKRFKASRAEIKEVERLIRSHMYDFRCDARDNKIRKYIIAYYDIFDKVLLLKQADFSACKDCLDIAPSVIKFKRIYSDMQKSNAPMRLKELNIKGNELIELGVEEKAVGEWLENLLYECAIGALKNENANLRAYISKILARTRK